MTDFRKLCVFTDVCLVNKIDSWLAVCHDIGFGIVPCEYARGVCFRCRHEFGTGVAVQEYTRWQVDNRPTLASEHLVELMMKHVLMD